MRDLMGKNAEYFIVGAGKLNNTSLR